MSKLIIIIILVALAGFGIFYFSQKSNPPQSPPISNNKQAEPAAKAESSWSETGVVIAGAFADADIVDLGNNKFRMYYSAEPETPGFAGQVYSSTSSDGTNWSKEDGIRLTGAIFPSVIKLTDKNFRMYFQDQQAIKSAVSSDGLSWEKEQGVRIDTANPAGLTLNSVVAPTVIKTGDQYLMVYGGVINEAYTKEKVPSKDTHLLLWASSKDGLTFEKKGIALNSRNEVFKGWMDGPELVKWDDNTIRLYLWGYFGIYQSTFENGSFSEAKFTFFGPNLDKNALFSLNPPGDPTLAKIGNTWNMYYGYHTKGIYRAILK